MKISELIKYLKTIKDQNGDLICISERMTCNGEGLLTEANVMVCGLKRPSGRIKTYKIDFYNNSDLKVVYFGRSRIDDVEGIF